MDSHRRTLAHLLGAVTLGGVAALDPGGWYPFGPTKWLAVSTLIAAAVAYAVWVGLRPSLPRWFIWVGGGLLAWTTLAAIAGRDPLYAWTGTPERRFGVVTWLLLGACCALGSMLTSVGVRVWVRWVAVATAWCGIYTLVELWFGQPVDTSSVTDRLGGPFGSAAYLGAALCLLLPIAGWVAADRSQPRVWRAIAGGGALLGAVGLIGSGARAAWAGVAVAGLFAAVASRPDRRTVAAACGVAGLALLVMMPRLTDVMDRSSPASSRLDEWGMASRAVVNRPVLGAGPEGYRTVVSEVVTAHYERTYGRDVLPDRAHNGVLDVAVTVGIPGALAYSALLGGVVIAAWRQLRRRINAGIAIAAVAYVAQQMFLFPLAELDPVLWIAGGVMLAVPEARQQVDTTSVRRAMAGVAGVVAIVMFVTGVLGVAADRAASALSAPGAERAIELRPDVIRYHVLRASIATASGTVAGFGEAIHAADRAVDISPHDPIARRAAAQARLDHARATGDVDDVAEALAAWRELAIADPNCLACQYGLGIVAALAGDRQLADQALSTAVGLSKPGDRRAADALADLRSSSEG